MQFKVKFENFPSPDGLLRYGLVPWDTETFGHSIYEIRFPDGAPDALEQHLPRLCDHLSQRRPALLVCKVPLASVARPGRELSRCGFYAVETLIEVHLALARFKPFAARLAQTFVLRSARPEDLPPLVRMAQHAFQEDRFHADPNLSSAKSDKRFEDWVHRGMEAQDPVFILEERGDSRVLGFFHVRGVTGAQKTVDLSLAAVDPSCQSTGLGVLLYQMVLLECRARGFEIAESRVSVANVEAVNLFTRLGFSLRNPVVTFHCYLDAAKPEHGEDKRT